MSIEPVLAHIDACGTITSLLFGRFLALHAGRAPFHLLRTRAEGRTDQAPPRSQDQGAFTVPPIRVGSAGRRTRRASQHALSRRFQHARCRTRVSARGGGGSERDKRRAPSVSPAIALK